MQQKTVTKIKIGQPVNTTLKRGTTYTSVLILITLKYKNAVTCTMETAKGLKYKYLYYNVECAHTLKNGIGKHYYKQRLNSL